MERSKFEKLGLQETFDMLGSSEKGLSSGDARAGLAEHGYNEITERRQSPYLRFLKKFYGPIPLMLEAVVVISFILNEMENFYIILALLIFNAITSFVEENKADNTVELLKKRLTVSARVFRDGEWKTVQARELVPGDVIRIRLGDIVPADAKIIAADYAELDQSVLTGESMPVEKKREDLVYSGSVVKRGEAKCVVVATGYNTFYGETTKLVQGTRSLMHLEKTILGIVKYLVAIDVAVVLAMLAINTLYFHLAFLDLVSFSLVVLIASIPVALPAAFTVATALGTTKLAKKSILVTKLEAIEEAATLDVICFDKTGTITKNKLEVKEVTPFEARDEREVIRHAIMASRASDQDPLDSAIIGRGRRLGIRDRFVHKSFTPFQPSSKMASARISMDGREFDVAKGAWESIAAMCGMSVAARKMLRRKVDALSSRQFRTIAVAMREGGKRYRLLGLIALYDKPRPDAKRLIDEVRSLGVSVKLLTGDNVAIAREVAKEVGIAGKIVDFAALRAKDHKELASIIEDTAVFAGIYPEDKYAIVKALQSKGHRVGMTGDGVNDAPALKQAEVGIAVATATDVAKSAADLVLVKDGIEVIISAIKESRRIFTRMITYTMAKVVRTVQIVFFVAISFLVLRSLPILAFEMVILFFTNDISNISLATDNAWYTSAPDTWDVGKIVRTSAILGIVLLLVTLAFIPLSSYLALSLAAFQTMVLFVLTYTDKFVVFSLREHRKYMWSSRPGAYLIATSAASVVVVALMSFFGILVQPLSAIAIIAVILASTVLMLFFDVIKHALFWRLGIAERI